MIIKGLLWFDDNPLRLVDDKVERAVQRYQQKYGNAPNVCYVHPSELLDGKAIQREDGIRIMPAKSVLPHRFWLGVDTQKKLAK